LPIESRQNSGEEGRTVASILNSGELVELLVEVSIKATVFAVVVEIGLRTLRVKDAALSHSIWLAVAVGMLLFPGLRVYLPEVSIPLIPSNVDVESAYHVGGPTWAPLLFGVYVGGVLAMMARLFVGLLYGMRLLADSRVVGDERLDRLCRTKLPVRSWRRGVQIRESDSVRVPMTIGFARPQVLLPSRWRA
jgi:beta-lactamase regulating signal transducer with metallopeptidase domain